MKTSFLFLFLMSRKILKILFSAVILLSITGCKTVQLSKTLELPEIAPRTTEMRSFTIPSGLTFSYEKGWHIASIFPAFTGDKLSSEKNVLQVVINFMDPLVIPYESEISANVTAYDKPLEKKWENVQSYVESIDDQNSKNVAIKLATNKNGLEFARFSGTDYVYEGPFIAYILLYTDAAGDQHSFEVWDASAEVADHDARMRAIIDSVKILPKKN